MVIHHSPVMDPAENESRMKAQAAVANPRMPSRRNACIGSIRFMAAPSLGVGQSGSGEHRDAGGPGDQTAEGADDDGCDDAPQQDAQASLLGAAAAGADLAEQPHGEPYAYRDDEQHQCRAQHHPADVLQFRHPRGVQVRLHAGVVAAGHHGQRRQCIHGSFPFPRAPSQGITPMPLAGTGTLWRLRSAPVAGSDRPDVCGGHPAETNPVALDSDLHLSAIGCGLVLAGTIRTGRVPLQGPHLRLLPLVGDPVVNRLTDDL
ncbi:hypothetical protein ACFFX0_25890 [Citricoccus parietis]|uniref:Uncharacterized protein n=1 Tax=Citricoccus parietis TaxID=592307 RepID=A0ABV5G661_9MICC